MRCPYWTLCQDPNSPVVGLCQRVLGRREAATRQELKDKTGLSDQALPVGRARVIGF